MSLETLVEMETRHAKERINLIRQILKTGDDTLINHGGEIALLSRSIAEKHRVTVDEMIGKRRFGHLTAARFEAYAAAYKAGKSLSQIGRFFNRDHTTILNGIRRYEESANE